jgi:hypothetical protein
MRSKTSTSCRQLAAKLRQVCDRLAASPGKTITSGKQPVRKSLANGKQVHDKFPKTAFRQNRGYTIDAPGHFPLAGRWRGDGRQANKGVLIFLSFPWAFRSALLASSEAQTNHVPWLRCRASLAMSGCFCALAPRGAPRLPAPLNTPMQSPFHSPPLGGGFGAWHCLGLPERATHRTAHNAPAPLPAISNSTDATTRQGHGKASADAPAMTASAESREPLRGKPDHQRKPFWYPFGILLRIVLEK